MIITSLLRKPYISYFISSRIPVPPLVNNFFKEFFFNVFLFSPLLTLNFETLSAILVGFSTGKGGPFLLD